MPGWFVAPNGESILDTGPSVVVSAHATVAQQAGAILDHRPAYLQAHATNLRALARLWLDERLPHPGIREVRSFAEVLTPETRALIRRAWDVPATDVYSTQECGVLALQCPKQEHLHVQSENAWVEVLRDDGRACAPGEIGRVVVTALHNFAMPLIRYDIGDYAEVGHPCGCGRGLPVLTRVMGRVRNMLKLPSGDTRWPLIGYRYRDLAPVRQFQAVQKSLDEVELRLVVERPLSADEEKRVTRHLLDRLQHPFRITLRYVSELPRAAGEKFEDFVCEV
jgi:phenylacetate-CoA ligase